MGTSRIFLKRIQLAGVLLTLTVTFDVCGKSADSQKNNGPGSLPDASQAAIPRKPAGGMIRGDQFKVQSAEVTGGAPMDSRSKPGTHWTYFLKLRQGSKFFADKSFDICIVTKPGEKLDSKVFRVTPVSTLNQLNPVKEGNASYPPIQGVFMGWIPAKQDLPRNEALRETY